MQIIDRLEWIHSKDLIYRDIKPENFLIGIDDPNVIYIVDFGLCKKYRSSKTGKHVLPKMTGKFNGNIKYCSPYVIKGKESSRRDDLISLGYMLIFLLKKELPWDNIISKKFVISKYYEIVYLKDTNGCGTLFKNIPEELATFVKYTKNLKFEQEPNYSYLRSLLNIILINENSNHKNLTFSWIDSKNKDLLKIPNSNSKRKSSSHIRLLKSLEERKRRGKSESLSEAQIKTEAKINIIPPLKQRNNTLDFNDTDSKKSTMLSKIIPKKKKYEGENKNKIKIIM